MAGEPVEVIFTPHLIPMDRGIFTTIYATPTRPVTEEELTSLYRDYYAKAPFVRVRESLPATKDTAHTNFLDVCVRWCAAGSSCWRARTTWSAARAAWRCRTSTGCSGTTSALR